MAENLQVTPAAQVIVEHWCLKNRAHLLQSLLPVVGNIETADTDLSVTGPDLSQHHSDGGALAGSIMAKQAEDFTGGDAQAEGLDPPAVAPEILDEFRLRHYCGSRNSDRIVR